MTWAFTFDANACSGCKACQEACKDKNGLPVGVLWRRVIEVSGGGWRSMEGAWENTVFAYNLSLACNHCTHPKCAGVCPTDAYIVRPDGIVLIESSRCMGCGYCAWACPYDAPQYIPAQGVMSKCNFCYDNLEAGLPPSCVAACPLRVLNYSSIEEFTPGSHSQVLWQIPAREHPFPLPASSRTEPRLVIKPHQAMGYPIERSVSNREEILPLAYRSRHKTPASEEFPLVIFTLLTQMAAGLSLFMLALSSIPLNLLLTIGLLLGMAGLVSFLHLGRKRNAWRAVLHTKKSWLSREILMSGLFGVTWAVTFVLEWLQIASPIRWLLALMGLELIFRMSRVYRLRSIPAWDTWRTPASFFLSALVLGALGVTLASPSPIWAITAAVALVMELGMDVLGHSPEHFDKARKARISLLGLGILSTLLVIWLPAAAGSWLAIATFLIALAAEVVGRWLFYAARPASHF